MDGSFLYSSAMLHHSMFYEQLYYVLSRLQRFFREIFETTFYLFVSIIASKLCAVLHSCMVMVCCKGNLSWQFKFLRTLQLVYRHIMYHLLFENIFLASPVWPMDMICLWSCPNASTNDFTPDHELTSDIPVNSDINS